MVRRSLAAALLVTARAGGAAFFHGGEIDREGLHGKLNDLLASSDEVPKP